MKTTLLLCASLALATGCVRKSELAKAQSELAGLQEKIRQLEQQRVPKADLDAAQAAVATAQEKTAALAQELKGTREQLAATEERVIATERRLSRPDPKMPETVLSPGLVKGSYTLLDDTIVYSRDAQLNFGNGVTISSPTGLMLSDKDRAIVAGDLVIETPRGTEQAPPASSNVTETRPGSPTESLGVTKK
jgi:hypothetical protein